MVALVLDVLLSVPSSIASSDDDESKDRKVMLAVVAEVFTVLILVGTGTSILFFLVCAVRKHFFFEMLCRMARFPYLAIPIA